MGKRVQEWITVAAWLRTLAADVIEADAALQVRQRQAWQDFHRSMRTVFPAGILEGIDRDRNLGVAEIRIHATLEALPSGPFSRAVRAVRRWLGRPVPPPNAYRIATPATRSERRVELDMTLSRQRDGTWQSSARSSPEISQEAANVPGSVA